MISVHDQIRAHIYEACGLNNNKMPPLEKLKETEWSTQFETLMRNRLIMGSIRYGRLRQKGLCEFEESVHPKFHFKSADDKVHTKTISRRR